MTLHLLYQLTRLSSFQIIEINLTDANPIRLDPSASSVELEFSYSVEWVPQDKDFKDRFNRFLDADFFEHKVRIANCSVKAD